MISIIIASVNPLLKKQITENIAKTIGCNYELLITDNTKNPRGLCELYNSSAREAKFPYLIFAHEDIIFHTQNWGEKIFDILNQDRVGLIGMAGAVYKANVPMPWISVPNDYYRSNAFFSKKEALDSRNSENKQVAVVDGMFLSLKKETWKKYPFNEELKGFHLYDIDLSYRLFKNNYSIVVPGNLKVEHLSKGSFDINWYKESEKWHLNKDLPIFVTDFSRQKIKELEVFSLISYLNWLLNKKIRPQLWLSLFFRISIKGKKLHFGLLLKILSQFLSKAKNHYRKKREPIDRTILNKIFRHRVKRKKIAIVSNNCWGGAIYKGLNKPYNSPFVGLYINSPCYIKMLKNFPHYINQELSFTSSSKYSIEKANYPIGILDDIEIHFLHYKTQDEAKEKWDRRKKRLLYPENTLIFKTDDRDFASRDDINEFHKIKKDFSISFTKDKFPETKNIKLKRPDDLILLHTTFNLFDVAHFLNTGEVKNTLFNKLQNFLFKYPPTWT